MEIDPKDPSLSEAMEHLTALEAAEQPTTAEPGNEPDENPDSASDGQRAGQEDQDQVQTSKTDSKPDDKKGNDTPAEAESKGQSQKAKVDDKAKTTDDKGSKFAKDQARRMGSWKELNTEKENLRKEQEAFKAQQAELANQKKALEAERAKASQPKYKPEDYEKAAAQWDKEAKALEDAGDFDKAAAKQLQAKQAREHAKHLRDNPPPAPKTDAQAEAEFKATQKEWWTKAAIDFPKVVVKDSPEAQALAALVKAEPSVINDPKALYYAARLVTAETAAAGVPKLEKDLGELRAKVKELNEQLAVPGDGTAGTPRGEKPFEQKTEAEQEAELYQHAEDLAARGL